MSWEATPDRGSRDKVSKPSPEQQRVNAEIQRIVADSSEIIAASTLNAKQKEVFLSDLKKIQNTYARKKHWDAVPDTVAEIESMERYKRNTDRWGGTN